MLYNDSSFNDLMSYIKTLSGVDLEPKKDITFQRISAFAKNQNISDFKHIIALMRTNSQMRQEILNLITVNETYFYREISQLNDVISYAKYLGGARILCAPCSSGDEVYSIAMMSVEAGLHTSCINLVGIDINSEAISQCGIGEYTARSLHRLNDAQKSRFFNAVGDKYAINKNILPRCEFRVLNIFDDTLYTLGKFDIVLSRNMMIYFDDAFRLKCVERLSKLLDQGGRLYTGHADLVPSTPIYEKKFQNGISYYQKV